MTAHRSQGVLFLAERRIEGIASLCSERQKLPFRGATLSAAVVVAAVATAALNRGNNFDVVDSTSAIAVISIAALALVAQRRSKVLKDKLHGLIASHDYGDDPAADTMKLLALTDVDGLIERGSTSPTDNGSVVTVNGNNLVYGIDRRLAK